MTIKTLKILLLSFFSVLAAQVLVFGQNQVLWDDSFESDSFNPNWGLYSAGTAAEDPVLSEGQAIFHSGEHNFGRSFLAASVDQSGQADFEGTPVFNFFEHPLRIDVSNPTLSARPAAGSGELHEMFFMVSTGGGQEQNARPRAETSGFFVRLIDTGDVYRLRMNQRIGTDNMHEDFLIDGFPETMTIDVDSDGWSVTLEGAVFTATDDTVEADVWDIIDADIFSEDDPILSLGSANHGGPSVPYDSSVDGIEATVIPEPSVVAILFGVFSLGFVYYRKRRDGKSLPGTIS